MLRRFSKIKNFRILAVDGVVGTVDDLLIDDHNWHVRYLVVAVSNTLPRRKVMISPAAVQRINVNGRFFKTALSSRHVLDSPGIDWDQPVSRRYEEALVEYYGWPIYWLGRAVQLRPQTMQQIADRPELDQAEEESAELRSAAEICGYQLQTENGNAGIMRDLIVNLRSWVVEYATADSGSWSATSNSTFSTKHIQQVDWSKRSIHVALSRQLFENGSVSNRSPSITGEPWSSEPERMI